MNWGPEKMRKLYNFLETSKQVKALNDQKLLEIITEADIEEGNKIVYDHKFLRN